MPWKSRVLQSGRLSEIITIEGERPNHQMVIQALIKRLEHERDKGATKVDLDGWPLCTLRARSS